MKKDDRIICVKNGITYRSAPFDGQQAVDKRLTNIIKLVMEVGRSEGWIGNHEKDGTKEPEGGRDVADKGNIRDRETAPAGKNKTGD